MRYTALGRHTGLRVSEYGLGTANFGHGWGGGASRTEAKQVLDRFAEAGGTLIDTADCYNFGEAEEYLGDFLKADRDHFVLASKYTCSPSPTPSVFDTGNSRRAMRLSVEGSLRRLNTDYLDLYWAHFADPLTPMQEIVAAFDDLVRAGKVLHVGLSNFPAWRVAHGVTIAELRGRAPIVAAQFEYSLVERTAERDLLPMADALGLGAVLWSPLGGGLLSGKYRSGEHGRLTEWKHAVHTESTVQKTAVIDAVLEISAEQEVSPAQVAMAWLRHRAHSVSTPFVPVIGPRTITQLDDYLDALTVTLTATQQARLDEVSAPSLGVPHEIGTNVMWRVLGSPEQVDRPRPPVA
ncbi:aldo/keto reductase [Pseudonocardiaceae bacterium YIM PH 21723]|nr:aldo/keto reductase [Pseudonocardiaceae bacterium YIM PH 21723]